ncbi:hypothetical protein [Moraxella lacunata]|uniref:hypothetical protein n=1 Tax=Moraxella lacunata TaxID=477 RepID=UPI003EE33EF2
MMSYCHLKIGRQKTKTQTKLSFCCYLQLLNRAFLETFLTLGFIFGSPFVCLHLIGRRSHF